MKTHGKMHKHTHTHASGMGLEDMMDPWLEEIVCQHS